VKRKHFDVLNRHIKLKDNVNDKYIKSVLRQLNKEVQESCHIVLHADASNSDIVKSTLALGILRRKLSATIPSETELIDYITKHGIKETTKMLDSFRTRRSRDSMEILQECREETDNLFGLFLKVLSLRGWATPARFMFGRVSMRAEWKIQR
jgi:hemerythrin-like domain-containing protein